MFTCTIVHVGQYDLRKKNLHKLPKAKTTSYGVESILLKGSFPLNDGRKLELTLPYFKNKIKAGQVTSEHAEYASNIVFGTWY